MFDFASSILSSTQLIYTSNIILLTDEVQPEYVCPGLAADITLGGGRNAGRTVVGAKLTGLLSTQQVESLIYQRIMQLVFMLVLNLLGQKKSTGFRKE